MGPYAQRTWNSAWCPARDPLLLCRVTFQEDGASGSLLRFKNIQVPGSTKRTGFRRRVGGPRHHTLWWPLSGSVSLSQTPIQTAPPGTGLPPRASSHPSRDCLPQAGTGPPSLVISEFHAQKGHVGSPDTQRDPGVIPSQEVYYQHYQFREIQLHSTIPPDDPP